MSRDKAPPGFFQYLKPNLSCLGVPPRSIHTANINSPTIAMILMLAKINSASPYILTAKTFRKSTSTMTNVIQAAGYAMISLYTDALEARTYSNTRHTFPVTNDDSSSIDFKTQNNRTKIPIVPAYRKSKSLINISSAELGNCTRNGKPSCHFPKALHLGLISVLPRTWNSDRLTTPQIAIPVMENPRRRLRGPALVKAAPIPRKRLVPIVPPIAMN